MSYKVVGPKIPFQKVFGKKIVCTCARCGHMWGATYKCSEENLPRRCPSCGSRKWKEINISIKEE